MILQALTAYYEALRARGEIGEIGWAETRVQYALELDAAGQLLRILPLESADEKGKAIVRYLELPAPVKRTSGVNANFLWDNSAYLLGIDGKGKPERTKQCFAAAKELHLKLLSDLDDPAARAICAFFRTWEPENAMVHPTVAEVADKLLAGANLTFWFDGRLAKESAAIRRRWQEYYDTPPEGEKMRCLVTGELVVPEDVHPAIKRVYGAQSSGAALVSFNGDAFCSYGRVQNQNAPVGRYAAFAYTAALNRLLSDSNHCRRMGDTTVVFWAEDAEPQYQDFFGLAIDGGNVVTDDDLRSVMNALAQGRDCDWNALPLHPDNRFYVLGLAPNAARLSVRFFLQNDFGAFVRHFKEHFDRLEIVRWKNDKETELPLWKLLRETVNQNSRDKTPSPQMAGDVLRSIFSGGRYPATLYQSTMLRLLAEHNVSRGKAAIIKAYLLRNSRNEKNKEALTVELNDQTTYLPYLLGRLFAVLENIQSAANPGINTTIKDKYLTSACETPSVVFPTLLKLAEKHLRKINGGTKGDCEKQLRELTDKITESFPKHLNLDDQGIFMLGYYHQPQERCGKKKN